MPEKFGKAGKSTYEMAEKRRKQILLMFIFGLGAIVIIYLLLNNSKALGLGGGIILALFFLLQALPDILDRKAKKKQKEVRRAIRGAKGEEKVESLLDDLDERFLVLHDVVSPYGNIDHLVISQVSGIYLLETKAHGGQVSLVNGSLLVNGHDPEKDFVAQCLRNAYWVRDQVEPVIGVKPWITPLLVFTNAFVQGRIVLKGVQVLNKKYLLTLLQAKSVRNKATMDVWEKREFIARILIPNEG